MGLKFIYRNAHICIAFLLVLLLQVGCNPDDEPIIEDDEEIQDTIDVEDVEPEFPQLVIPFADQLVLEVDDTIAVNFTDDFRGFNEQYSINEKLYIPFIRTISLGDIELDTAWIEDLALKIWSKELLPTDQELTLELSYEWTGNDISEEVTIEFQIKTSSEGFPIETLVATYPLDRQYYFLKDEYPNGFFHVSRLPNDISGLTVSIYDGQKEIFSSGLTKNSDNSTLEFEMPAIENEQMYHIELRAGENVKYALDFRTSKFDTFQQKITNLELLQTFRGLHIPWSQHYLVQYASIQEEGFDLAEASYGLENLGDTTYQYCNGLVQLEFVPEGNSWYEEFLYPIVFEPFADSKFEPEYAAHPNLGEVPVFAMFFGFDEGLPALTDEEISTNISTQTFEPDFWIMNLVQSAAYYDFTLLQQSVLDHYGNSETNSERVKRVLSARYNLLSRDTYRYNMNYRLPDGTISSTHNFEMIYD